MATVVAAARAAVVAAVATVAAIAAATIATGTAVASATAVSAGRIASVVLAIVAINFVIVGRTAFAGLAAANTAAGDQRYI